MITESGTSDELKSSVLGLEAPPRPGDLWLMRLVADTSYSYYATIMVVDLHTLLITPLQDGKRSFYRFTFKEFDELKIRRIFLPSYKAKDLGPVELKRYEENAAWARVYAVVMDQEDHDLLIESVRRGPTPDDFRTTTKSARRR